MQSVCSFSQSVSGSSPQALQRPRSLPLRRGLSNSRRPKETLELRSLVTGKKASSSLSSPSKGAAASSGPTSTSKKNKLNKDGDGGSVSAGTTPSANDFVRAMRTLLFLTRPSPSAKSKGGSEEDKAAWKPRTSLDVSGHAFGKALKAELRKAKELQGHTDLEALSRDSSPFQAALRHQHLSQLRSPKGGFSGYKDWADDDTKSDMTSCASFTSTLPPSPPPTRSPPKSALPPRCPPRGGPKRVSRRSRQPCAVRERSTNAVFANACPPAAEGLVG
ncbi:unnamed protein product [Laminaria digitata]